MWKYSRSLHEKKRANTYGAHGIDDGRRSLGLLAIVEPGLLAHQRPQLVQVDGGAVGSVPLQVVVSHTHLTEVPRMAEETRQNKVKKCSFQGGEYRDTQKAEGEKHQSSL